MFSIVDVEKSHLHPYNSVQGFQFFQILASTFVCVYINILIITPTDKRWYLIVVLICIFLMISGAEYLFIYLLAICVSSWRSDYSVPLPIFKWVMFFFFLLSCRSFLYIFYINSLSDIWLANIFFHSIVCLFFSSCWWFPVLCRSF